MLSKWLDISGYPKKTIINSACVSILICANCMCWALSFIPGILFIILLLDEIVFFVNNRQVPKHMVWTIGIVVFIFIFNFLFVSRGESIINYFLYFMTMGIFGYHMGSFSISTKHVILFCSLIGILLIPYLNSINFEYSAIWELFGSDEGGVSGYRMGISYGTLRMYLAIILALFFYVKRKSLFIILLFGLLFYTKLYINIISRGCVVSILLLLFFITEIKAAHSKKYQILKLSVLFFLVLGVVFFDSIIAFMIDVLSGMGFDPFFLTKMVDGASSGDLSNGRSEIYHKASNDILESPLWGNGIAAYEERYQEGYIHNYLIQSFYEMGIGAFIYMLILTVVGFKAVLRKRNNIEVRLFMAFLICSGVIELLFSSTYWRSQVFWVFIGYTTSIIVNRKKNRKIIPCENP